MLGKSLPSHPEGKLSIKPGAIRPLVSFPKEKVGLAHCLLSPTERPATSAVPPKSPQDPTSHGRDHCHIKGWPTPMMLLLNTSETNHLPKEAEGLHRPRKVTATSLSFIKHFFFLCHTQKLDNIHQF